jgi:hypothetical protein
MPLPEGLAAPPLDAEKTSTEQLKEKFRWPRGLELELTRSTLLVGTRGSGKTMFLRRCRHKDSGLSLYGDLRKVLNPLTRDTGAAGLSFKEISASSEQPIREKAIALLSQWLFARVSEAGVPLNSLALRRVLPDGFMNKESMTSDYLSTVREKLEISSLSDFRNISRQGSFEDLLQHISEKTNDSKGALTILLDRAEEIPYPGLPPVMQLLDQRHEFLTIVATRPGILGPDHQMSPDLPVPGDHYNIKHLGSTPYGQEWRTFVAEVLDAWLPRNAIHVPKDEFNWLLSIARDSLRNALELLYNALDKNNRYDAERARAQLKLIRETQMKAAQGQMRRLNGDLKGLLKRVRQRTEKLELPISVSFKRQPQSSLFDTPRHLRDMTRDEQVVYLGLRTGLFTTLDGVNWHPFGAIDSFEIPPLFIWEEGDPWSSI